MKTRGFFSGGNSFSQRSIDSSCSQFALDQIGGFETRSQTNFCEQRSSGNIQVVHQSGNCGKYREFLNFRTPSKSSCCLHFEFSLKKFFQFRAFGNRTKNVEIGKPCWPQRSALGKKIRFSGAFFCEIFIFRSNRSRWR